MLCTISAAVSVILVLLSVILALTEFFLSKERQEAAPLTGEAAGQRLRPPGPRAWPLLGSLPFLALFPNPWEGFSSLRLRYGDIFAIQLGAWKCVVVNSANAIREVLVTKAGNFGGRPDFTRYHVLFGGDRENSLALCEWTPLQKFRRKLAHSCLLPRSGSAEFDRLEEAIVHEHTHFLDVLKARSGNQTIPLKTILLQMTANIFFQYLCSCRFPDDHASFQTVVRNYDLIFYDINQGYLMDFLPWLAPVHCLYFRTITKYAKEIRTFIEAEIIDKHRKTIDSNNPRDFVDVFLLKLAKNEHSEFTLETALFELEDLVGGHPGVANLCMKALGHIAQSERVQARIFTEVKETLGTASHNRMWISLRDRHRMPFTEATVLETLRLTSSPIVPHVATADTEIGEWTIDKGTMVIFNNYRLNLDKEFWNEPELFNPDRFLADGIIVKPDHFFPFSTGRRTCLGYSMVQNIIFFTIASTVQHFRLSLSPQDDRIFRSVRSGTLALPPNTFSVTFAQR